MEKRKGMTFFEVLIILGVVLFPVVLLCIAGLSSLMKHYTKKSIGEKLAQGGKKLWDNREYLIDQGQRYLENQKRNAVAYGEDMRNEFSQSAQRFGKDMRKETKKKSKKLFGLFG